MRGKSPRGSSERSTGGPGMGSLASPSRTPGLLGSVPAQPGPREAIPCSDFSFYVWSVTQVRVPVANHAYEEGKASQHARANTLV